MGRVKFFRGKVRDIRVHRVDFGKFVTATPERDFSITFIPKFYMWFHDLPAATGSDDIRSFGLEMSFMFWSFSIFDYSYRKKHREPWIEDHERHYIEPLAEYMRKQKH